MKARRKVLKISQEELAQEVGVARQTISTWERCSNTPDTRNLIRLTQVLNTSLDYLLGRTDSPESVADDNDLSVQSEVRKETKVRGIKQTHPTKLEDFAKARDASRNLESLDDHDLNAIAEMLKATMKTVEKEQALRAAMDAGEVKPA